MPATGEKYNGWTNYETWAVNLWMDNEESSQRFWRDAAETAWEDAEATENHGFKRTKRQNAIRVLAALIEDHHGEYVPEEITGVYSDLLNAAMDEVNWEEIAESLLEECSETPAEEEDPEPVTA